MNTTTSPHGEHCVDLHCYPLDKPVLPRFVSSLCIDSEDRLWFSTTTKKYGGGVLFCMPTRDPSQLGILPLPALEATKEEDLKKPDRGLKILEVAAPRPTQAAQARVVAILAQSRLPRYDEKWPGYVAPVPILHPEDNLPLAMDEDELQELTYTHIRIIDTRTGRALATIHPRQVLPAHDPYDESFFDTLVFCFDETDRHLLLWLRGLGLVRMPLAKPNQLQVLCSPTEYASIADHLPTFSSARMPHAFDVAGHRFLVGTRFSIFSIPVDWPGIKEGERFPRLVAGGSPFTLVGVSNGRAMSSKLSIPVLSGNPFVVAVSGPDLIVAVNAPLAPRREQESAIYAVRLPDHGRHAAAMAPFDLRRLCGQGQRAPFADDHSLSTLCATDLDLRALGAMDGLVLDSKQRLWLPCNGGRGVSSLLCVANGAARQLIRLQRSLYRAHLETCAEHKTLEIPRDLFLHVLQFVVDHGALLALAAPERRMLELEYDEQERRKFV